MAEELKIIIVGGGRGGSAIYDLLSFANLLHLLKAVVDINPDA